MGGGGGVGGLGESKKGGLFEKEGGDKYPLRTMAVFA